MRVAVIDTETTGIPSRHPFARVVEVGAVVVDWTPDGVTEIGAFESLARPSGDEHRLPEAAEALRFNRLTVAQIDAAPLDYLVGDLLERWLNSHSVAGVAAFNSEFDFDPALLGGARWLGRYIRVVPVLPCLMERAKERMGLGRYDRGGRLTNACRHFGVPVLDAHEALADARMAASLIPHVWTSDAVPPIVAPPRPLRRSDA